METNVLRRVNVDIFVSQMKWPRISDIREIERRLHAGTREHLKRHLVERATAATGPDALHAPQLFSKLLGSPLPCRALPSSTATASALLALQPRHAASADPAEILEMKADEHTRDSRASVKLGTGTRGYE